MNGIFLIDWIEEEAKDFCHDRKVAFMEQIFWELGEHIVRIKMDKVSPDPPVPQNNKP